MRVVAVQGRLGGAPLAGGVTPSPLHLADLPEALAELRAHQHVDQELGEAVAEAEPHAVEVDLLGDVLALPALDALRHADEGEGQPGDEEHGRDDEADVVVPRPLREVLVNSLHKETTTRRVGWLGEFGFGWVGLVGLVGLVGWVG